MKVLVAGGAGYVGSHTVSLLLREGHDVAVYDNLSTGDRRAIPEAARFILGDVRDGNLLQRVLRDYGVEAVVHFAAKWVVAESVRRPWDYYETNVIGGLSILQACRRAGVQHFIFSSSAAVYGESARPVHEDDPTSPVSPYGASKRMLEEILERSTASSPGWISLRYFNVAGAAEDGRNGQWAPNSPLLVKAAAEAAVGKRNEMRIYGDDYQTPDGTCVRDFIHVEDLAEAHISVLRGLCEGRIKNDIYNCGYGHGFSVKEVIETMKAVSGQDFSVAICERRPGDPAIVVADAGKIKNFGWRPTRDSLELICKSTYDWEIRSLY